MTGKEKRITEFLLEARIKIEEIIDLAEKYDLRDDLISAICVGVIKDQEEGYHKIDAITSIFADSKEELESVLFHLSQSYMDDEDENNDMRDIDFWMNLGDDSIN